jgi:L-ornithine Nalpha-acyltransferase
MSIQATLGSEPIAAGNLEVILATSEADVHASQALRYRVFVNEIGAIPSAENKRLERDMDEFDAVCDHLLVVEHNGNGGYKVVGTYRLLRRAPMQKIGRFYTASEFDISPMVNFKGEVLELGRSCVDIAYRNRSVMQLLWRGITAYVEHCKIDIMFGCGSLYGADVSKHAATLSYLYHSHLAPEELRIRAIAERYVSMNILPLDQIDVKRTFVGLPPLIKGYLRLGGFVGDGAVLDPEYNTTDVAIIVKTQNVTGKYVERYASASFKEALMG